MPFAVTHFLAASGLIVLGFSLARKKLPRFAALVAGIGGIIPDVDVLLNPLFDRLFHVSADFHRVFTHNLLLPLIGFLTAALLATQKRTQHLALLVFVFSVGLTTHLVLDCALAYTPGITLLPGIGNLSGICPPGTGWMFQGALDGVLFTLWVGYLLFMGKLRELW